MMLMLLLLLIIILYDVRRNSRYNLWLLRIYDYFDEYEYEGFYSCTLFLVVVMNLRAGVPAKSQKLGSLFYSLVWIIFMGKPWLVVMMRIEREVKLLENNVLIMELSTNYAVAGVFFLVQTRCKQTDWNLLMWVQPIQSHTWPSEAIIDAELKGDYTPIQKLITVNRVILSHFPFFSCKYHCLTQSGWTEDSAGLPGPMLSLLN